MSVQNIPAQLPPAQSPWNAEFNTGDMKELQVRNSARNVDFSASDNDHAKEALQSLKTLRTAGMTRAGANGKDLDLVVLLTDLATKMRKLESSIQQRRLNIECEDIRNRIAAKSELTRQIAEKAEIARQRQATANISNKASSVLSAILVISAGILAATGIGSPLAAILICSVGALAAIDMIMSSFGDQGLGGTVSKWLGGSDNVNQIADIATKITFSIILLCTGVGAAASLPSAANIGMAALSIATTGSSGVNSFLRYCAQSTAAEATTLQAQSKSAQAIIQFRNDEIDRAMALLRQSEERFNDILSSIISTTRAFEKFHIGTGKS